jgi:hypothetical protein
VVTLLAIGAVVYVALTSGAPSPAPPAPTPPLPARPAPVAPQAWLGLNYNSGGVGRSTLRQFAARGIVYDREGGIEVATGQTPANSEDFGTGLDTSYSAGMVPDIEVDPVVGPPGCESSPDPGKLCLPVNEAQITEYVEGFVRTASATIDMYPGERVLFEPMDEPWNWGGPPGTPPSRPTAAEYAELLAQLLASAKAARIPLSDIIVPATGKLQDGTYWVSDLYAAQPCLKPGPDSCGPISGWNVHPYGLPDLPNEGIESVPRTRSRMISGQDNIVVSEIGFCATDVDDGLACAENQPDVDGTSRQTARWLSESLQEAAAMHRAGWLKALLVWERSGSGWAMQNANGTLTAQGRVLELFAQSPEGR